MTLHLLHPKDFDDTHKAFVAEFRRAMATLSTVGNVLAGAKDVNGRMLAATDQDAHSLGVRSGPDLEGMHDREVPCEDVVRHADEFAAIERELMAVADREPVRMTMSILDYATGLTGRFSETRVLVHRRSGAVIGTAFFGYEVEISDFMAALPRFFREFGVGCTIERAGAHPTPDGGTLAKHDHEVAFLLSVGWGFREIAAFMAFHQPESGLGTPDAIQRCVARIGERMGIEGCSGATLRELLVTQGMHRRAPPSLFRKLAGVHSLHDWPLTGLAH